MYLAANQMDGFTPSADDILQTAVRAVERGDDFISAIDALQAPIYVTDAEGLVTHFNPACVGFAGRTPTAGKDRWCVTWKLYTEDGTPLPHDQCPMAVAIRDKTSIRGVIAIAERPDGARVTFMPFPTPILDKNGELVGAINMLIDVTEFWQVAELREQARRCRRIARDVDERTNKTLALMASEYDAKADELETGAPFRMAFPHH
jgi:PAS domain-containing protein